MNNCFTNWIPGLAHRLAADFIALPIPRYRCITVGSGEKIEPG
ncbi:hypothetical protein L8C07_24160 [Paenibacillus sp. CMAA1739]|nr:hypothetical protein [Paenibacillus sp. CMAA1739]